MPLVSLADSGRSVKEISGSAQNLRLLEHIRINYSDFCYNVDKSRDRVVVFTATFNISVYNVGVSFIGGGNRSTQRKSQTCRK